jgi:hypothetical protein
LISAGLGPVLSLVAEAFIDDGMGVNGTRAPFSTREVNLFCGSNLFIRQRAALLCEVEDWRGRLTYTMSDESAKSSSSGSLLTDMRGV